MIFSSKILTKQLILVNDHSKECVVKDEDGTFANKDEVEGENPYLKTYKFMLIL